MRVEIRLRGLQLIDIRFNIASLEKLSSQFLLLFIRIWLFLRLVPLILEKASEGLTHFVAHSVCQNVKF